MRVWGEVRFPVLRRPLRDAAVRVRVDDVTRADVPANTIASSMAGPVSAEAGTVPRVSYAIEVPQVDPKASYAVTALADLDGDGQISRGDYATRQRYPVLTRGFPDHVDVEVVEII